MKPETGSRRPLIASARDGWLPSFLARSTKKGVPYVMGLLYLIGVVPILLGMDLGDVATICLFPGAITKIFTDIYAMTVPGRFKKEWGESGGISRRSSSVLLPSTLFPPDSGGSRG